MQESIITYEVLYEILRKERYNQEIQQLDSIFFQNIVNYLKEKTTILKSHKSTNSIFAQKEIVKTQKQIDNTKSMLKELYERRENKILQKALFASRSNVDNEDVSQLLSEEQQLYKDLEKTFNSYRTGILSNVLSENMPKLDVKPKELKSQEKGEDKTRLIRFTHASPQFVGDDLNIYGPFEAEDIANLPIKVANLLIEKKRASYIEIQ